MRRMLKIILFIVIVAVVALLLYYFVGKSPVRSKILWGVNFSQMQAENLRLDWKKTYLAILEDLGVKNIKLLTQWDWVEGEKDDFYFNDVDWQLDQAKQHNANIVYV